ncbi:hypothetical protein PPACK8108_LOCUS2910 [Phakopsora pachyrhizi]|uniref:MPN domain-containing protein n=1 Tax=Phakopsora pachyrhizi TaxID=170000 RepID=A0AAV0AK60_PHAPC|nr:hypothetical protein PPACK8108_LOCUS2910 [Phakopsora pachyrhizi]
MICPSDLIGTFVAIATPETERGVELCGLLLGRQTKRNALVITTLLIPKQVSTSDTCATTDEDETFRYQDQENLMTLGWIHTHPTQTCFMSSVDLHTHASYQLMMAEAVAIVCSPKKNPSVGFFRLTYPIGLETIVNCKLPGLFHPHPSGVPIYTDADRGGHFKLEQSLELDVVDLRD